MKHLRVILSILFVLLVCSCSTGDKWGNKNHEEAISFTIDESKRQMFKLNQILAKAGHADPTSFAGDKIPPSPRMETKDLKGYVKKWSNKVPKDDKLLTSTYDHLETIVTSLGKLYGLRDNAYEYNQLVSKIQTELAAVRKIQAKLSKRPGGYEGK